jgi:Ca2+/H+ antiporter
VDAIIVGIIVFTCTFAGALLGMWLRAALPKHWLDAESRDTVKVGVGLIATMTAVLVTNSGRSTWFVGVLVLMVYLIFAMTLYVLPPRAQ